MRIGKLDADGGLGVCTQRAWVAGQWTAPRVAVVDHDRSPVCPSHTNIVARGSRGMSQCEPMLLCHQITRTSSYMSIETQPEGDSGLIRLKRLGASRGQVCT